MVYTILLADDEAEIRQLLRLYLEKDGYRVLEAENGVRAVSLLNKEEIHLALLDIMMPGKNGYEVLAHLRRQSNIPVVFLSAKGADEDKNMELDIKIPDEPIPLKPKSSFSCVNRKYSFDRCL